MRHRCTVCVQYARLSLACVNKPFARRFVKCWLTLYWWRILKGSSTPGQFPIGRMFDATFPRMFTWKELRFVSTGLKGLIFGHLSYLVRLLFLSDCTGEYIGTGTSGVPCACFIANVNNLIQIAFSSFLIPVDGFKGGSCVSVAGLYSWIGGDISSDFTDTLFVAVQRSFFPLIWL